MQFQIRQFLFKIPDDLSFLLIIGFYFSSHQIEIECIFEQYIAFVCVFDLLTISNINQITTNIYSYIPEIDFMFIVGQ